MHESRRMFDDSMCARVQLDDGELSARFYVCQGLRKGCVLSLLLFSVSASAIEVILPRFAAGSFIVSYLACLDDASKYEDNKTHISSVSHKLELSCYGGHVPLGITVSVTMLWLSLLGR